MAGADQLDDYRRLLLHALGDIQRMAIGLAEGAGNVILLSDYEVVNLRAALQATGYGMTGRSPLQVLNNGDWLGQIYQKLPYLDHPTPNADAFELQARALRWK